MSGPQPALRAIASDQDELCGALCTTASALKYLAFDLIQMSDREPLPYGLRDALLALIDRNQDLAEKLIGIVERAAGPETQ